MLLSMFVMFGVMLFCIFFCLFYDSFCSTVVCFISVFFFFFKQKTAYEMRISDWSSDVCSSDLTGPGRARSLVAIQEPSRDRQRQPATTPPSRDPPRRGHRHADLRRARGERRTVGRGRPAPRGLQIRRAHV